MSIRVTIVLATVLALAAVALWRDAGQPPAPQAAPRAARATPSNLIFDIDPRTVSRIVLRRGARELSAERSAGGWPETTHPAVLEDALLRLSRLPVLLAISSEPDGYAAYGLAHPDRVLEIHLPNGAAVVAHIGRNNPAGTGTYVRVGDRGPIYLAGSAIDWEIDKLERALSPPSTPRRTETSTGP